MSVQSSGSPDFRSCLFFYVHICCLFCSVFLFFFFVFCLAEKKIDANEKTGGERNADLRGRRNQIREERGVEKMNRNV